MLIHEFVTANRDEVITDISYDYIRNRDHIGIPDNIVLKHIREFTFSFRGQWDYIGNVHQGINYHGITIILNEDLNDFLDSISKLKGYSSILRLQQLCKFALMHGQDIVHFGI